MTLNPPDIPAIIGPRNKANLHNAKDNHVRLPKIATTKQEIIGPNLNPAPIPSPGISPIQGPFTVSSGEPYWLQQRPTNFEIWFDVDSDPDPDFSVDLNWFMSTQLDPTDPRWLEIYTQAVNIGWQPGPNVPPPPPIDF